MLQLIQLLVDSGIDARVSMTEEIDPPGSDSIEIALAMETMKPCTFPASDGNQGKHFVLIHLGAGMPDELQAARLDVFQW